MRTQEEWDKANAAFIVALRNKAGLSRSKMAMQIGVDPHTLAAWEDGKSAPSSSQMIHMFEAMGQQILPLVLEFLYPDVYQKVDHNAEIADVRNTVKHFVDIAPEHFVRQWDFLIRGEHGVNFAPLLQLNMMLLCLPVQSRYVIDQLVDTLWDLNAQRNALRHFPGADPDVQLFKRSLDKLQHAVYSGHETYTTVTGEKEKAPSDETDGT